MAINLIGGLPAMKNSLILAQSNLIRAQLHFSDLD
jgi:hypothetical protein